MNRLEPVPKFYHVSEQTYIPSELYHNWFSSTCTFSLWNHSNVVVLTSLEELLLRRVHLKRQTCQLKLKQSLMTIYLHNQSHLCLSVKMTAQFVVYFYPPEPNQLSRAWKFEKNWIKQLIRSFRAEISQFSSRGYDINYMNSKASSYYTVA